MIRKEEIVRILDEACDKDKVNAWHNGFWILTQEEVERFAKRIYETGIGEGAERSRKLSKMNIAF